MVYHVNPETGETGKCDAKKRKCPYGSPEEHFPTPQEARDYYEKSRNGSFGNLPPYAQKALLRLGTPEKGEAFVEDSWGDVSEMAYGDYSQEAKDLLVQGQCLGFAVELSRVFGTNKVAVHHQTLEEEEILWDEETNQPVLDENGEPMVATYENPHHAYAVAPDGSLWDGLGPAPRELIEPLENAQIDIYEAQEAQELYEGYLANQDYRWSASLIAPMLQKVNRA